MVLCISFLILDFAASDARSGVLRESRGQAEGNLQDYIYVYRSAIAGGWPKLPGSDILEYCSLDRRRRLAEKNDALNSAILARLAAS